MSAQGTAVSLTVAALSAAALGSLFGSALWLVWGVAEQVPNLGHEGLLFPLAIPFVAFFAFWIVLPALVCLGIPLFFLLRRWAHRPLMMPSAVLLGAAVGWVMGWWLDGMPHLSTPGALYGATAGYFWHRFTRNLSGEVQGEPDHAPPESVAS